MGRPIYLDYNATTPLDPRVLEAMLPFLTEQFGNSMSLSHEYGWAADSAVENCRSEVAQLLGCHKNEITWTSGATESNNWAIQGVLEALSFEEKSPVHILTSAVEHASVLKTLEHVRRIHHVEIEEVPVEPNGQIRIESFRSRLKPHTRLVCMMWVQNEIGSIYPVAELGELCREHQIYFLCDATQAIGKIPVNLSQVHIDLLSFSAHKLYGPKGVGFLYHRRQNPRVNLSPMIYGGGHEHGERSGTLNVPGIVGLTTALKIAEAERENEGPRLRHLRDQLWAGLSEHFRELRLNGPALGSGLRVPHNLNFSFSPRASVPPHLPGLAFSRGSACYSGKTSNSHVLRALGLSEDLSQKTLRLSLGRMTRPEDIDQALNIIKKSVKS